MDLIHFLLGKYDHFQLGVLLVWVDTGWYGLVLVGTGWYRLVWVGMVC